MNDDLEISTAEVAALIKEGNLTLIDVRTPYEMSSRALRAAALSMTRWQRKSSKPGRRIR